MLAVSVTFEGLGALAVAAALGAVVGWAAGRRFEFRRLVAGGDA
jgi:hypothetical protein